MAENIFLKQLIDDAADALDNMYDVTITFPGGDEGAAMTVRATGFDIPEAETEAYTVKYKGSTYYKPKSSMNFDRKFSLEFRVDAAYNVLETFGKWHSYTANPATGGVANIAAAQGTVEVVALSTPFTAYGTDETSVLGNVDDNGVFKSSAKSKKWLFENVWAAKVGQPKFKTESSGDPHKITVDFYFGQTPSFPGYTDEENS